MTEDTKKTNEFDENKKPSTSDCSAEPTRIGTLKERLKAIFERMPISPSPVYKCQKCKDDGIVLRIDTEGNEFGTDCECVIRNRYERICANAGFPIKEAKTISDYQGWNEDTSVAKAKAEVYIRDFDTIRKQHCNWFIVFGQSGSGKTMLGRAIVKALIERKRPVRARAVKYYEMMQKLKSKSNDTDYGQLLDQYTNCELLFIDDLLKEKAQYGEMTEADIKHLFAVIDRRYEACLPTIITSECTSGRINELDVAIYGRMHERAFAEIIFEGTENNYRKRG